MNILFKFTGWGENCTRDMRKDMIRREKVSLISYSTWLLEIFINHVSSWHLFPMPASTAQQWIFGHYGAAVSLSMMGDSKNTIKQWHGNAFHITALFLTHWGRDNMAAISQTTLSSAFSWMKMFEFRLKFLWNMFLRVQLTIFHHWFR